VSHGADDFVSRASGPREIALRLRALRHRKTVVAFDTARGRFLMGGRELDFSTTEQALFSALFENTGFTCTRSELVRRVWGAQPVHSRTLDNHVMRLREKLGPAGRLVESVRGVGYRLSRDVLC
jgi:two-component system phosphate regulon response regulator PhoB